MRARVIAAMLLATVAGGAVRAQPLPIMSTDVNGALVKKFGINVGGLLADRSVAVDPATGVAVEGAQTVPLPAGTNVIGGVRLTTDGMQFADWIQPTLVHDAAPSLPAGAPYFALRGSAYDGYSLPVGCRYYSGSDNLFSSGMTETRCDSGGNLKVALTAGGTSSTLIGALANKDTHSDNATSGVKVIGENKVRRSATWYSQAGSAGGLTGDFPWAPVADSWTYASGAGGVNGSTAAVTIRAADASATRQQCIRSAQISAGSLSAGTEVILRGNASGTLTTLWGGYVNSAGQITGPTAPVCAAASSLIEVALGSTVTGPVYVNVQGWTQAVEN